MTLDVSKLAKVLELTRSPVEGERSAAINRANAMLEGAGMSWSDLLLKRQPRRVMSFANVSPAAAQQGYEANRQTLHDKLYVQTARDILYHPIFLRLNEFEQSFLRSLDNWRGTLSAKQRALVDQIRSKVTRMQRAEKEASQSA